MPDLNGNLASFGVRSVLELLAASGKSGELRLSADGVVGRALFHGGLVAYATTATDGDTARELEELLSSNESSVDEVLREQLTEVFHELVHLEAGTFEFAEATGASHVDDHGFSVDDVLADVEARAAAWRRIKAVVPSTAEPYRMAGQLPGETADVTIDATGWRLIATVGESGSVEETAEAMGLSTFRVAEQFAELVGSRLLEPVSGEAPTLHLLEDEEEAADDEPMDTPEVPRVQPTQPPVTISRDNLTREEMDEMIRNIGKGIYPT